MRGMHGCIKAGPLLDGVIPTLGFILNSARDIAGARPKTRCMHAAARTARVQYVCMCIREEGMKVVAVLRF